MNTTSKTSLQQALIDERPLQVVGVINAYTAMLAERAGFKALYLSGAGLSNACFGLADIGITRFDDVLEQARRILAASKLPLLVDIDTGFSQSPGTSQAITALQKIGVAGVHIEDQQDAKRCGHLAGKQLVDIATMQSRLQLAIDAKTQVDKQTDFVIMARTDAYLVEGLDSAIARAQAYQSTGVDMVFAESLSSLEDYKKFTAALNIPVLANITEFGLTPLFSVKQLQDVDIDLVLYPLTAFRAMSKAAIDVFDCIRQSGSQQDMLDKMQTRDELYDVLDYKPTQATAKRP